MTDYDAQAPSVFEDDLFRTIQVKELQNEDFLLQTVERIALRATGCSIVLFYTLGNRTSTSMRAVWNELSERFAGVNFFAVNASRRINIMKAFDDVKNDNDHPLNAYRLRGFPTILVYREGGSQSGISWPKAFYNGELSTTALQNWILTLACEPGYTETPTIREGVVSDLNITVDDPRGESSKPASSLDFQSPDFDVGQATYDEVANAQAEYPTYLQEEDLEYAEDLQQVSEDNLRNFSSSYGTGSIDDPGYLNLLVDSSFQPDY
ncbi:MAG: protein disulfide isomerase family protein [Candidatus Roizmanbacteria bacterium]